MVKTQPLGWEEDDMKCETCGQDIKAEIGSVWQCDDDDVYLKIRAGWICLNNYTTWLDDDMKRPLKQIAVTLREWADTSSHGGWS